MAECRKKYDLDLSRFGDEQLVVLAQECGFRPAVNELLQRHHPRTGRWIAYQASQTSLTAHDVEDAQQNAVFALIEAIDGYNTLEMTKPNGCRFRTYARLVTLRRFWSFVKHIRRWQKRYHSSARLDGVVAVSPVLSGSLCPEDIAARHEMQGKLSRMLEHLEKKERSLWQALAAGKRLRQIAREQGISYDAAKRQRRRLLAQVKNSFFPAPFQTGRRISKRRGEEEYDKGGR